MKQLILSIFLISFAITGFSQRFNGGAVIGLATSQVAGDSYSGFHKVGPAGGVFVNFQPTERSSFQMELMYIQKGSRKSADVVNEDYNSYLLRLNYIELPLLYQFHFNWFMLEAGPSVGFFMSGKEELDGSDQKKDNFAAMTFQMNFGVVFTFAENFKFGIRTNNSLTNLRTEATGGDVRRIFPNNYGEFNDVILFTFAYEFLHFGK